MRDKRPEQTTKLGEVLRRYLSDRDLEHQAAEHLIPAIWAEVVGPWYAQHTAVARVWEGIVEVACDSAARAQQLQLDSAEIIRRLNQRIGKPYVRQIRPSTVARLRQVRAGMHAPASAPRLPTEAELEEMPLDPEAERLVAAAAEAIEDPTTREAFEKAARTHLKVRAWKLAHGWRVCKNCGELCPPGGHCVCALTRKPLSMADE